MKKITVVFPMAGKGERFGGQFKPFIEFEGKTFIEHAILPFLKWSHKIKEFRFIVRRDHFEQYNIQDKIQEIAMVMFSPPISINRVSETASVCETIETGMDKVSGPVMFVDCDNSVNVDPLFDYILAQRYHDAIPDCIVPIWSLIGEDVKNWSIASINEWNSKVTSIAEKKYPKGAGDFYGVIGCYYFKKLIPEFFNQNEYVSGVIEDYLDEEKKVGCVKIQEARFFGDPNRLTKTVMGYKGTIFIDFDGTIVKHQNIHTDDVEILPGSKEKMQEWFMEGYYIVITTGRKNDGPGIHNILNKLGVPFHYVLYNLPSGPRYVINDRKPWNFLGEMAEGFNIDRDEGIENISIKSPEYKVLKRFGGASFSQTFLVSQGSNQFVRKIAYKNDPYTVKKLKNQYARMFNLQMENNSLVPGIFNSGENNKEYFYDLEYLPNHKSIKLNETTGNNIAMHALYDRLKELYKYAKPAVDPESLLTKHYDLKVGRRLEALRKDLDEELIDEYIFLAERLLQPENIERFLPSHVSFIHGDLTFENILYNEAMDDIKFIDLDNENLIDMVELDLGKLFQSTDSKYEFWSQLSFPEASTFERGSAANIFVITMWKDLFGGMDVYRKAYLYLSFHMVRALPYRLNVSPFQADYTLKEALFYIKKAIEL